MTTTTTTLAVPDMCCTVGNHNRGYDLGTDWTCRRAARIHLLNREAEDIQATTARRDAATNPWRRENLTRWIGDATARMSTELDWFAADNPTCAGERE